MQITFSQNRKLHEELNVALNLHPTERPVIRSPGDAFDLLRYFIAALDHEEMWVMLLDTRNRVMGLVQLYYGSYACGEADARSELDLMIIGEVNLGQLALLSLA